MKLSRLFKLSAVPLLGSLLFSSCDWESGSKAGFSTTALSQLNNISGFYQGNLSGGRAVQRTSNGNILHLTIQQGGNTVQVVDSQGSRYRGTVGAPASLAISGQDLPAGAVLSTYQISFSGKDGVANRDIEFTGVVSLVTVSRISADLTIVQGAGDRNATALEDYEGIFNPAGSITPYDPLSSGANTPTEINERRREADIGYGEQIRVYQLSEQNTQFRLRGTWVEAGGVVSQVDAVATGVSAYLDLIGDSRYQEDFVDPLRDPPDRRATQNPEPTLPPRDAPNQP